jgi:hypothetical protein
MWQKRRFLAASGGTATIFSMMSPLRLAAFGVALALAAFVPDAAADANSLNDNLGPREIAIGESMRADSRGALATTLNPAGLGLDNKLVFEGSFGFRPGDDAYSASVSACDSTVPIPGCFYYQYFSAEPVLGGMSMKRRAHEFGTVLARRLTPRLTIGVTSRYFDYSSNMTGEEDADGFSWDIGMVLRATPKVSIAGVGYNLFGEDSAQYPRAVATGLTARFSPTLAFGVDALWNLETPDGESTGRYGGGLEYYLTSKNNQSAYPIRVGGVYDNQLESGYLTGGLGFGSAKLGIDIGARKQVSGGDELMVQASLRLFGPKQNQPRQMPSRFIRR